MRRPTLSLSFAVLWFLCSYGSMEAQEIEVAVDIRAGPVFPVGDLAKVTDTGVGFGLGLLYRVGPRVRLRTDVGMIDYTGRVDVKNVYVLFGAQVSLLNETSRWGLDVGGGIGFGVVKESFGRRGGTLERVFGGALVDGAYRFSDSFAVFIQGQLLLTGGSRIIYQIADPSVGDSGALVSIPVEAGFRFTF